MIPPLQRITLVTQVADALRRGLEKQEWLGRLPPEQELASQFQVSRFTIRGAMKVLIDEGLLRTSAGRRAEIVGVRRDTQRPESHPTIGILSPDHSNLLHSYQEPLREQLRNLGFRIEFYSGVRFYRGKPAKALEALIRETRVDCWVMLYSTAEMQRWFARQKIPAIVDGTRHEGVSLPALDVDYRAISRHAVGTLLGLGHRRIALLIPKTGAGGDMKCEEGFLEGAKGHASKEVQTRVIHPDSSGDGVAAAVRRAMATEAPPSAFIVERGWHILTVLTCLMHAGYRVPKDVSLISLSDDPYLRLLVPSISYYAFTTEGYARQLTQMISKLIGRRGLRSEQRFILPSYEKGESVGLCEK